MIVPKRIRYFGIGPINSRTFSERSSILSCLLSDLVSKFKLVFYEIKVGSFFFNKTGMITCLNNFSTVKNNYLISVFYCRKTVSDYNNSSAFIKIIKVFYYCTFILGI